MRNFVRYSIVFILLVLLAVGFFAQESLEVIMDCDKTIVAHFKKIQYTLNTLAEPIDSGTITGNGIYDIGTIVEVEAIPAQDYVFDHWNVKWSGLGMGLYSEGKGANSAEEFDNCVDILLANGFTELRIDIPDYPHSLLALSKAAVIRATAKGANVIWGVSSNAYNNTAYTITAESWPAFRQAILDAAQWAQDNGVYEFQLGNEEENHVDGTTMTVAQIMTNLKSVATDVQTIFTRGNISYTCARWAISYWVTLGKGDIDILASNIYRDHDGVYDDFWKTQIEQLLYGFGADGTYITEFGLDGYGIDNYSADEAVQETAVSEMIEYIKTSGIERAFYFCFNGNLDYSIVKADGTYRLLWDSLINSGN